MMHDEAVSVFRESENQEQERIRFLEAERGRDQALDFARQTVNLYRRAVVHSTPPAGEAGYRLRLMGSYCCLKRYLHGEASRT